jgi:hypothetical protein
MLLITAAAPVCRLFSCRHQALVCVSTGCVVSDVTRGGMTSCLGSGPKKVLVCISPQFRSSGASIEEYAHCPGALHP